MFDRDSVDLSVPVTAGEEELQDTMADLSPDDGEGDQGGCKSAYEDGDDSTVKERAMHIIMEQAAKRHARQEKTK